MLIFLKVMYSQSDETGTPQWAFTCSKLTIETLEQGVKQGVKIFFVNQPRWADFQSIPLKFFLLILHFGGGIHISLLKKDKNVKVI